MIANWLSCALLRDARLGLSSPVHTGLGSFEKYLHTDDALPPLVRAGLLHAQLETIHPYLDCNGRIGRLMVTLLLEQWKLLTKPLLYLSLFFKGHRAEYYRRLDAVRAEGDWEGWLDFFLDGVATIAEEAVASARELFALVAADRARVLGRDGVSAVALRLFELLPRNPVVTVASVMQLVETTKPTAERAIDLLAASGVLVETTGKKRDRSFVYRVATLRRPFVSRGPEGRMYESCWARQFL